MARRPVSWDADATRADLTRRREAPRTLRLPARPKEVEIDLTRTACVVVDMQNDFCTRGGWLDHIGVDVTPLRRPIAPLNELLTTLRAESVPVIFLNWGNRPDRANLPPQILHVYDPDGEGIGIGDELPNGSRVLEKGSWSAAIVDEIGRASDDIMIDKFRMTGFVDTELDSVLRNHDVSTVLFCGVNVDQCVYATLTDAAALGYDCVLLEDCCATTSPPGCAESTLYNVAQCFGFVSSAEALCAAATQQSRRLPATRSSLGGHRAHRISAGDSVKLAVVHRPTTVYDTSVFLEIWEPGGAQPPNSHPGAVETFLFLIGSGRATCDGSTQPVRAQDFLVLPPGSVHYIENTGATRLYAVTTMSPDNGFCALVEAGVAEDLDGDDLAVLAAMSGG